MRGKMCFIQYGSLLSAKNDDDNDSTTKEEQFYVIVIVNGWSLITHDCPT